MSLKEAPYYWVVCDECGVSANADSEYAAWADKGTAYDEAVNADWVTDLDDKDYCWTCSPYPMCAECGQKTAQTEWDDETFCDECIAIIAEDESEKAAT